MFPALYPESLSLKDGTVVDGIFFPLTEDFTDDGLYQMVLALPEVIDPPQVDTLLVGGAVIPLS